MPDCSICALPALTMINRALALGAEPIAALARKHHVTRQALLRHREAHMPQALVATQAEVTVEHGSQLLADIDALRVRVGALLTEAEIKGDTRGAVTAIREGTRLIELIAKLQGALQPAPSVVINLAEAPEFQAVRARIIAALDEHPLARADVIQALGMVH